MSTTVYRVFSACVRAIQNGNLIVRESQKDKEFHFQNWFRERLVEMSLNFDVGGRNTYPDFSIVEVTEGYELKGLAYPGRDASFDSNSQIPMGRHNGRDIYYVFGRYPKDPDGNSYPVLDLVVCHGDFLNRESDYVHKNKSVKGFGTYGDILIRDRKMYVVPTPFRLADGLAHKQTLILPQAMSPGHGFTKVGDLVRLEAQRNLTGYQFNLTSNELTPSTVVNSAAGSQHKFSAWRVTGASAERVTMRSNLGGIEVEDDDE